MKEYKRPEEYKNVHFHFYVLNDGIFKFNVLPLIAQKSVTDNRTIASADERLQC